MLEKDLISRIALARRLGVKPATIATWEGDWFPIPELKISDRLIMYGVAEVEKALRARHAHQKTPPATEFE